MTSVPHRHTCRAVPLSAICDFIEFLVLPRSVFFPTILKYLGLIRVHIHIFVIVALFCSFLRQILICLSMSINFTLLS